MFGFGKKSKELSIGTEESIKEVLEDVYKSADFRELVHPIDDKKKKYRAFVSVVITPFSHGLKRYRPGVVKFKNAPNREMPIKIIEVESIEELKNEIYKGVSQMTEQQGGK